MQYNHIHPCKVISNSLCHCEKMQYNLSLLIGMPNSLSLWDKSTIKRRYEFNRIACRFSAAHFACCPACIRPTISWKYESRFATSLAKLSSSFFRMSACHYRTTTLSICEVFRATWHVFTPCSLYSKLALMYCEAWHHYVQGTIYAISNSQGCHMKVCLDDESQNLRLLLKESRPHLLEELT